MVRVLPSASLTTSFAGRSSPGMLALGGSVGSCGCQLGVAVDQHIVGNVGPRPLARALQAARSDVVLPQNAAAIHLAPASGGKCRVDVLGSGFGFVHGLGVM
jgi:hypothetical protein